MQDFCGRTAWPQFNFFQRHVKRCIFKKKNHTAKVEHYPIYSGRRLPSLIRITWSLFVNIVMTVIELRLVVTHDLFGVRSVKCYYFKDQFPILRST